MQPTIMSNAVERLLGLGNTAVEDRAPGEALEEIQQSYESPRRVWRTVRFANPSSLRGMI